MENQIYRIELEKGFNPKAEPQKAKLEFYVCTELLIDRTNDATKEESKSLGIVVLDGDKQIDGCLDVNQLEFLIKYLEDCKDYIQSFNYQKKKEATNEK